MSSHISVTSDGIKVPQASEIKTAFQDILKDSFGSDINLDDSTSQGVWVDDLTDEKMADNAEVLYLFNQFNPETASGVFQDALASLFGLERKIATHSVVNCQCIGIEGTVLNGIDSGNPAMAISTNGDKFECVTGGTIDSTGTITLQFRSVETGAIPCSANTINGIFGTVIGWDSINNSASGTVGEEEESQYDFEQRRKNSLALNATGSLASVYSGVFNIKDVTDVLVEENDTGSTVTKRGVSMTQHSIYVCVNGLTNPDDLAKVIFDTKSAGCDTIGSNTCSYTETFDNGSTVTHTYKYDTPTDSDVYIKVIVSSLPSAESQANVKNAIFDDFNGDLTNGNSKITIGSSIYASRFLAVVSSLGLQDVLLEQIQISKSSSSGFTNLLTYNMNILPTLDKANITFEVSE